MDEEQLASEEAPAAALPPPSLDWMDECLQWGTKAEVGPHGLTARAINTGIYGEIPDQWTEMTRMPRGAYPVEGVPRIDLYSLTTKAELWAENSPELYEEAIQRRWQARSDIAWESIPSLPGEVELAFCQVCTELAHHGLVEAEVIGNWLHRMCYGYHEVKNFLATEVFDSARHVEAFRQRAMLHEGTMGLENPGWVNRRMLETRGGWTEAGLFLYIMRGPLTLLLCRYCEWYAATQAEKKLFRLALQDKARHFAYGMAHLKYAIEYKGPSYALGLKRLLTGSEQDLHKEMQDPVLWEALAIVFGGGLQHLEAGMAVVRRLRRSYIEEYVKRLQWVGIEKTTDELAEGLREYLTPEAEPA